MDGLADDVAIHHVDLAPGERTLRFFPDGSSSGELITLSGGNRAYYLQLNWLTGSITITEGSTDV